MNTYVTTYSSDVRKYQVRWHDSLSRDDTFTRPTVELTVFYDPAVHDPALIRLELEAAMHSMILAIETENP